MAKTVVASSRSNRWQWAIILALFVGAALLGFTGQVMEPPHPQPAFSPDWWRAVSDDIFITMLYFTFSAPADAAGSNVFLHIARFLAPVATVSAIVKIVIQAAWASWLQAQLKYRRGHIVIVGFGALGQKIGRHFLQSGARVVALDRFPTADATELSEHLGIPLIVGDGTGTAALAEVAANHASAIFFVTDNDIINLEASAAASSLMKAGDKNKTRLLVHLGNLKLSRQLKDYERRIAFIGDRQTSVTFFNLNDMLARQLLSENPLHQIARWLCHDQLHILIIGLSDISDKIIHHTILSQRTEKLGKPCFTIIDTDAASEAQQFHQRHPGIEDVAALNFVNADPRSDDLSALVRSANKDLPLTATILCLDGEVDNLSAALEIHAAAGRGLIHAGQILVKRNQTSDFFELLSRIERYDLANMLRDFGEGDHELFVRQISGDDDALAIRLHEAYCQDREALGDTSNLPWDMLPESNRRANRRAADHLWTKLASCGYHIEGSGQGLPDLADKGAGMKDPGVRARLARLEHDRWWADRVMDGWQYGDVRNDEARHHPSLVPFDDLTPEVQAMDGEQVDFLTDLLADVTPSAAAPTRLEGVVGLRFGAPGPEDTVLTDPSDTAAHLMARTGRNAFLIFCRAVGQAEGTWLSALETQLVAKGGKVRLIRLFEASSSVDGTLDGDPGASDTTLWLNLKAAGPRTENGYPCGLTPGDYLARQCDIILDIAVQDIETS